MDEDRTQVFAIAIVFLVVGSGLWYFGYLPSPPTSTTTGSSAKGCFLDQNSRPFGCTNALKAPLGQDIVSGGGQAVYGMAITSAVVSLNYTGTPMSWSLTGSEVVNLDRGLTATYPIAMLGQGAPQKSFNLTLQKTRWLASELQSAWGVNYGAKKSNVTLNGIAVSVAFTNGQTLTKPASSNYLLTWAMTYTAPASVSLSTPTVSVSGGTTSGGTQNTWITTITAASGGATGNTATNGVIVSIAPDIYFQSSQTIMWAQVPVCSGGYFATIVTPTTSVREGKIITNGGIAFSVQTVAGSPYLVQIRCADSASTLVFNQVVTASPAQPLDAAPSPPFPMTSTTTATVTASATTSVTSATYTTYWTTTVGTDGATTSVGTSSALSAGQTLGACNTLYLRQCLSVVSITF